jgi:large conductance mechanosensitive channel
MLEDFKKFIMRGNVLDLAVAVVIGAAFKAVVDALVAGIIMPLVGAIGGKPSFDEYVIEINESRILWGTFVTQIVNFLIIAAALFVVVKSFERLQNLRASKEVEETPTKTDEAILLTEIRDLLASQPRQP